MGRYPAKNIQDVSRFIEKIKTIENNPTFGPWRQKVTLIADDAARPEPTHGSIATGQSHTVNSEQIADLIPLSVNVEKLYMMEYPEVSDASAYGVIKPEATEALFSNPRKWNSNHFIYRTWFSISISSRKTFRS